MNIKKLTALLLAAVLLLGLLTACGNAEPTPTAADAEPTEAPATEASPANDTPFNGETGVTSLSNYAVLTASPHDENMSAVIALDADGNPAMTNSLLQFTYWLEFFNFMNSYGSYAEYFGLDASTPLAEQSSMSEGLTWEQYFLDDATKGFAQQYALYRAALDENYVLSDEEQATLDDILDPNGSIVTGAAENGYASATEYMQATFGNGVDLQDYYDYVTIYLTANSYYTYLKDQVDAEAAAADDATLEAYFDAHADSFTNVQKVNNVSVRHILIQPEGETDENGEYSADAWAAAEATANEIYEQWKADPTEDNFAALANEKSSDPGSNTTGGLYEDFDTATMVAEFTEWSFDPARVSGDTGIVKTSYGYHIMYFVGQTETRGWLEKAREQMPEELLTAKVDEICAAYPVTFDFTRMRVFDIVTMMVGEESAAQNDAQDSTQNTPAETVILPEDTFEP